VSLGITTAYLAATKSESITLKVACLVAAKTLDKLGFSNVSLKVGNIDEKPYPEYLKGISNVIWF
jgi:hypothetical protein